MSKRKKVIIDLKGALRILKRKNEVKITETDLSSEYGIATTTFQNWDVDATKAVTFVYHFLKDNPEIDFNDLVKEV